MDFSGFQLNQLLNLIGSPAGIFALLSFTTIAAVSATKPQSRWWIVAGLLFAAACSVFAIDATTTAIAPLQIVRLNSRVFAGGCLLLLLIPSILAQRGWRQSSAISGLYMFFVFHLCWSARALIDADFGRAVFLLIIYFLGFQTLVIGVGRWLQEDTDADRLVGAIVGGVFLFVALSLVQYAINPRPVAWNGRFLGLSGNANHAGAILALGIPSACYLSARKGLSVTRRLLFAGVIALIVVCLAWTGSRGSVVMAATGVLMLYRFRLGRLLLSGALVTLAVAFVLVFISDADQGASRLLDMSNSRSGVWSNMIVKFLENPLFGVGGAEDTGGSENSFLLVATRSGILGLIPFGLAVILTLAALVRLQLLRSSMTDKRKFMADLAIANFFSLYVGGFFEGFLAGAITFPVYVMYLNYGLVAWLSEVTHRDTVLPQIAYSTDAALPYPPAMAIGMR